MECSLVLFFKHYGNPHVTGRTFVHTVYFIPLNTFSWWHSLLKSLFEKRKHCGTICNWSCFNNWTENHTYWPIRVVIVQAIQICLRPSVANKLQTELSIPSWSRVGLTVQCWIISSDSCFSRLFQWVASWLSQVSHWMTFDPSRRLRMSSPVQVCWGGRWWRCSPTSSDSLGWSWVSGERTPCLRRADRSGCSCGGLEEKCRQQRCFTHFRLSVSVCIKWNNNNSVYLQSPKSKQYSINNCINLHGCKTACVQMRVLVYGFKGCNYSERFLLKWLRVYSPYVFCNS